MGVQRIAGIRLMKEQESEGGNQPQEGPGEEPHQGPPKKFNVYKAANTARGHSSRTPNQFDVYKVANTARGHSSRAPLNQSDVAKAANTARGRSPRLDLAKTSTVIKKSDTGAEYGSHRPGEELQQGQTSQNYDGRGQEGPSPKRREEPLHREQPQRSCM